MIRHAYCGSGCRGSCLQKSGGRAPARTLAEDFVRTVEDLSQYLSVRQELGNNEFQLSDTSLKTIETWGTPAWFCHGFAAQGPATAKIMIIDSLTSPEEINEVKFFDSLKETRSTRKGRSIYKSGDYQYQLRIGSKIT